MSLAANFHNTGNGLISSGFVFWTPHYTNLYFMVTSFSKKISPASFRETCQWLTFPLNGLWTQSRVSPVVGLLPLGVKKDLKITPVLDKLLDYKRSWIQHVNRMPRNRLPRVMKYYSPTGRRNHGRPLKRLLDTWDRNGSTSGPTAWKIWWW